MAHDALHVLLLEELLAGSEIDPPVAHILHKGWRWAALGAVLIDLPYFEGFAGQVWRELRGRAGGSSPWGDRFHRGEAMQLARALLDEGRDDGDAPTFTALALGHLTHAALDIVTHPVVNRLARLEQERSGIAAEVAHRRVENVQVELWHRARRGGPLFGARAVGGLVAVRADYLAHGPSRIRMERLLQRELGASPSPGQWRSWTLGLWEYAGLVSSPLGHSYLPESTVRENAAWYQGHGVDFPRLFDQAIRRSAADLNDAMRSLSTPGSLRRDSFLSRFPEVDLDHPEPAG